MSNSTNIRTIEIVKKEIIEILKSGNNSVESAAKWAKLHREREQLENLKK